MMKLSGPTQRVLVATFSALAVGLGALAGPVDVAARDKDEVQSPRAAELRARQAGEIQAPRGGTTI
jgi:hypothetical protein